jgi:hypothetical protein
LSNTIWALATLRFLDGFPFVRQLLREAEPKLRNFNSQAIANTIWSLATLDYSDTSFIEHLLVEAAPKLRDFNTQELSNTIWALATLKYSDGSAFIKQLLREEPPSSCSASFLSLMRWLAYLKEKLGPYISQENKRKREGTLISDDSSN